MRRCFASSWLRSNPPQIPEPEYNRLSDPLFKLLHLFPTFVLTPLEKDHSDSIQAHIEYRLSQFVQGNILELFNAVYSIKSRSPAEIAAAASQEDASSHRVAQIVADSGNLRAALKHLSTNCPRVLLDDEALAESDALYPSK